MCPVLFHIGSFEVRGFGLMLMIAAIAGIAWAARRGPWFGLPRSKVLDAGFYLLFAGVLGARLGFIVQDWSYYQQHPDELWSFKFEGLTSFGGVVLAFPVLILWAVRNKVALRTGLDVFAAPFVLGSAIGRVGCLLNGCCYGGPVSGFPGVHFEGVPGLHHPAQIYDSLMVLAGLAIVAAWEKRRPAPGLAGCAALMVFGISRFIYEFWRAGSSSTYWGSLPITEAQAMALFIVLLGLAGMAIFKSRPVVPQGEPSA